MASINRMTLINVHMILAAFVFPVALMFLITGGFYTWGIKGGYLHQSEDIAIEAALVKDAAMLQQMLAVELASRGLDAPTGQANIKSGGTSWKLEWTGSNRDVVLEPTGDPLIAKLSIKDTSWYRQFVQLHKAKGGQGFKVYAAILAISLATILASGFWMALQVPRLRTTAIGAALAGLVVFVLTVSMS